MRAIRKPLRQYYVSAALIVAFAGAKLHAQQPGADALHAADTVRRVPLFPRSLAGGIDPAAPAPTRFQIFSHEIDSLSTIGGQMETAASARQGSAQEASRFFLIAQTARGFGRRVDWVSAVTAAGITELAPSSGQGLWGNMLRGDGQMAGLAGLTGGASWLLSNLERYSPLFGFSRVHAQTTAKREH